MNSKWVTDDGRRKPGPIGDPMEAAASAEIAGLRLGSWTEVHHRLMVRMVPVTEADQGGPDAPLEGLPDIGPGFRLDVGVDLETAIVMVDQRLLNDWGQRPATVTAVAVSNTARRLQPTVETIVIGKTDRGHAEANPAVGLTFIAGTRWASGAVVDLERFVEPSAGPLFASWFSPTTLAVFGAARDAPDPIEHAPSDACGLELARRLVDNWFAGHDGPGRPNLLRVRQWPEIVAIDCR